MRSFLSSYKRRSLFISGSLLLFFAVASQAGSGVWTLQSSASSGKGTNPPRPVAPNVGPGGRGQISLKEAWQNRPESAAAAGDLDPSFDPGTGATIVGNVYALAKQSDGKIVLGGSFSSYDGVSCNGLARVNSDGSLDTSFSPGTPLNTIVYALAIQLDGKILLAGNFVNYSGVSRRRIARVNGDGSLDASFDPGTGARDIVRTLAIQGDGKILLGGDFFLYNGVSRNGVARINADGGLDMSFSPGFVNNGVYTIAIQGDGKVLLGGKFTQYDGQSRGGVARANSDGSLDTTFNPGAGIGGDFANVNIVYALAIQNDGKILIGGEFRTYNNVAALRITRVNSNGSVDALFGTANGASGAVDAIAIQSDGKILLGGSFSTYRGADRNGIARLNSDASLDMSFDQGKGATGGNGSLPANFNTVNAITIQNDGKILFGGGFTRYDGVNCSAIARADSAGSLDMSFNAGQGPAQGSVVYALGKQTDGKILLGGLFTSYNGVGRSGIARVNGDGSLDPSFNPGAGVTAGTGPGAVFSVAIQSDGKILVGGAFSSYNGVSRNGIARFNNDGALDMSFDPGAAFNPSLGGNIYSLAIQSDGRIVLGGIFSFDGVGYKGIARLNSDGSYDSTFTPGTNAVEVDALAIQGDGRILLGGGFTNYNNVSRNFIARINSDGSLDTSFDPGTGADSTVFALAIQSDGKIIAGGNFTSYNNVSRGGIARVKGDGSLDTSFNPGTGTDFTVDTLAIQGGGGILLAGPFITYNGVARNGIARANSDGSLDTSFDPGVGVSGPIINQNVIRALAIQTDGRILLGGGFGNYGGVGRNGIARILPGPSTVQFSAASYNVGEGDIGVVITVNRGGDLSGASTVDFTTSDGTAKQKSDYEVNNGTLSFAAGEASKTFKVLIVDDAFINEGPETINLTLSNPNGAVLGSASATITIADNDTAGSTSPVAKQFVANLIGAEETPATPNTVNGNGGIVQLDAAETSAKVSLIFSGLGSSQTAAHIHGAGAAGVNAPILFPLPTTNPVTNFVINPIPSQVADLKLGLHYMNVHSTNFPDGEIRGQLLWNPMEEADLFVRQAYFDFLSRSPDVGGLAFWSGKITDCQSDVQCLRDRRIDVSNQFYAELEFQQTGAYVYRLYRAAYGNNQPFPNTNPDPLFPNEEKTMPSYPVFVADRTRVTGSANLAQSQLDLATLFVQRAEFLTKYPASLNTAAPFVDAVLATIQTDIGVPLNDTERQHLITNFVTGGRALVIFHLANDYWNKCAGAAPCLPAGFGTPVDNRPLIDAEYNRAFVLTEYWGYLRRNPDLPGFSFWLGRVNSAPLRDLSQQRRMVCVFSTSAEFQNRFGLVASRNNTECQ